MITTYSGFSFAMQPMRSVRSRPGLPWLTSAMLFLAFFLGVHDLQASHHWLKTEKGELSNMAEEESSGRAGRQIGFLLLGGVGVTLLLRPAKSILHPAPVILFPLAMLLLWALFSVVWSADPGLTLKRQIVLLCMLLAASGCIKQFTLTQLAEMVLVQTLLIVLLGVVVEAIVHPVLPITDGEYRFAGTLHPNHMGVNASLLLLGSLFVAADRGDRRFYLISAIAIATLLMTKSRTALSSAIVGAVVFAFLTFPPRKRLALVFAILLAGGVTMLLLATDAFSHLGQTVLMNRGTSDPTTLTGRTMIWQFAFDRVRDDWGRMFTGFGYGGFWTPQMALALSQRAQFALSEGHNAYLDVMLQLGLPGVCLYLWCVFGAVCVWITAARRQASIEAALAASLICFAINHHLAESALTAPSFPTLILWCVIGSAAFAREAGADFRGTI